ncbi:hypothetical protein C8034_v004514 [Colletotrichum sidae]|uniref:Uncharacterized protein n=1 Tax=Colletotrichum sidae TaxID=1347389 RepID=A0A4R8T5I7_9PEZI|nr:hypothetical protein C8034_v004514 [Colletotrichum sidae]
MRRNDEPSPKETDRKEALVWGEGPSVTGGDRSYSSIAYPSVRTTGRGEEIWALDEIDGARASRVCPGAWVLGRMFAHRQLTNEKRGTSFRAWPAQGGSPTLSSSTVSEMSLPSRSQYPITSTGDQDLHLSGPFRVRVQANADKRAVPEAGAGAGAGAGTGLFATRRRDTQAGKESQVREMEGERTICGTVVGSRERRR